MKNIERNARCFCGSGKKFKKCCDKKSPINPIKNAQVTLGHSSLTTLFQREVRSSLTPSQEGFSKE
ncbi:SEC-C metal-binding domain-containing protein [Rhabdochlamydiaceae symbiont of Dictyostelium giganteum]|uniref:SEC-C metal-binding domain-containing protein n=1 Tax=Rhabdochlamydiaceae symbiont of Dictyostelium giganteum TaxID=3342349 RepID=UPI00384CF3CC